MRASYLGFALTWSRTSAPGGRMRIRRGSRLQRFLVRHGGMQLLDLPNLAAREQDRRAQFNSGRVIEINLVSDERLKQAGRAEQDEDAGQNRDRGEHEHAGQNFITS